MRINEIRVKDVHKIVEVIGKIYFVGEVEHIKLGGKWECQSCGTTIHKSHHLEDKKMYSPERCSCGNNRKFDLISDDKADIRKIKLKEFEKVLGMSIPLDIWISEDLIEKETKIIKKGKKVKVRGMIILSKRGENCYALIAEDISGI